MVQALQNHPWLLTLLDMDRKDLFVKKTKVSTRTLCGRNPEYSRSFPN
jgi:hypothetical protein